MSLQAVVLAGGLGTRLRGVVSDVPKVMAPVAGRPFLERILGELDAQGFRRVVLAVGYLKQGVVEHFGSTFRRLEIVYSQETEPLGTGGAVRLGLQCAEPGPCFVVNGDTWVEVDYADMLRAHRVHQAVLTMAVRHVPEVARFGALELEGERVVRFIEKGKTGPGTINAGLYLLDRSLLAARALPAAFSLENDFLAPQAAELSPLAYAVTGQFIDIGTPEDYRRAQEIFADVDAAR